MRVAATSSILYHIDFGHCHAGHGREFLAGRTGEVTLTRGSELAGDRAPKISFLSLHLSASLAQKTITYSRYLLSILDTDTLFD